MANEVVCSVCMGPFRNPMTLNKCRHMFCLSCLDDVQRQQRSTGVECPDCRQRSDRAYIPSHNRIVRQMCLEALSADERRATDAEWAAFERKHALIRPLRRFSELDAGTSLSIARILSIHRMTPTDAHRFEAARSQIDCRMAEAARLRADAKQLDELVAADRNRMRVMATQIP